MGQKCSICTHPKKTYINKALVAGKKSLRDIARQYGVTKSAVENHRKRHLSRAIQTAKKNGVIKEGKTAYEQFMAMLEEAEAKYNGTSGALQVQWFREWRSLMESGFKLGMEAQRERERQEHGELTPALQELIDRVANSDAT